MLHGVLSNAGVYLCQWAFHISVNVFEPGDADVAFLFGQP